MFEQARSRRRFPAGIAAGVLLLCAAAVPGAGATTRASEIGDAGAVLYRVFLRDGTTLVSYGEFARVADRVILSIPLGGTDSAPALHLVTVPESEVDWERTDAYAHAARARRYAETRGEADFARLTREVADTLNRVGAIQDPAQRLALAESARRRLVNWPMEHFGYRAEEVGQLATWLDQVVSELRIAAGQSRFDLALVATPVSPARSVPLLPSPDFRERIEMALAAARRTAVPAERVSLLQRIADLLQAALPGAGWASDTRARAVAELERELRLDREYAALTRIVLRRAVPYAGTADVRGLESLVRLALEEDARLGRARPAEMVSLLATLDAKIDRARRLRLARDAWEERKAAVRRYWREVRSGLDRLLGLRDWLVDVRQLAGPAPRSLRRLVAFAEIAERELAGVEPPPAVAQAHATLLSACSLARRAAAGRLEAVRSADMAAAWQASSAAAGSLMLLDRALGDLREATNAPPPTGP